LINREELAVCLRRGHDNHTLEENAWSQCKWCGLWLREQNTIEEREDPPPGNEMEYLEANSRKRPSNGAGEDTVASLAELAICRRRGHNTRVSKQWSKCNWCGFWLRERAVPQQREDEPPESEMSSGMMLQRMAARLDTTRKQKS
jgi:hypothetical protein